MAQRKVDGGWGGGGGWIQDFLKGRGGGGELFVDEIIHSSS